ncbi:helix-turn-helix domain-containing protein [Nocardia brasiliensis]|uniref:Helix-turn-helix domain-containing protein n=1 Tax=Nocardia brasiliensis TaxID=37326 RepID=A0A6G9XMP5_NOCBR|nr:AraC family transcriptional regulator [Nocardia brasiliensis]QIS02168.1 helix-turn-helix domain-containing protein [Nocardia brasiliensis]
MDSLDPEFTTASIPPAILVRLLAVAADRGVDAGPWFTGTGISPAQLDAPDARVSYRQATMILRRALRAMPAGPTGLAVGTRNAVVGYGLVGFAMRSSRTVGDAVTLGLELHRLAGSLVDPEFVRRGDHAVLRVFERLPDQELSRFLAEEAMAAMLAFARSLVNAEIDPIALRLSFPAPEHAAEYRRYFRCPVEFGCAETEMVFCSKILDWPLPTYSEANLTLAREACERMRAGRDARPDSVASVESILGENLRRSMTMAEVAEQLFVTERTLRRHLQAAGEKFSEIRDRVRRRRALFLVRETGMTIAQIAVETGFSDAREFRRAYVRWNGEPPSRTRSAAAVHWGGPPRDLESELIAS